MRSSSLSMAITRKSMISLMAHGHVQVEIGVRLVHGVEDRVLGEHVGRLRNTWVAEGIRGSRSGSLTVW